MTIESLELAPDLLARLEGRSSLGRLGIIVHGTASVFDPGWIGNPDARARQRRHPAGLALRRHAHLLASPSKTLSSLPTCPTPQKGQQLRAPDGSARQPRTLNEK